MDAPYEVIEAAVYGSQAEELAGGEVIKNLDEEL